MDRPAPLQSREILLLLALWMSLILLGQLALTATLPRTLSTSLTFDQKFKTDDGHLRQVTLTVWFNDNGRYSTNGNESGTYTLLTQGAIRLQPEDEKPKLVHREISQRRMIGELLLTNFTMHGSPLLILAWLLHANGRRWTETFGLRQGLPVRIFMGAIGAAVLAIPLAMAAKLLSSLILIKLNHTPVIQEAVRIAQGASTPPETALIMFWVIVMAPLAEECLFRGILYPAIKDAGHPRLALWASGLLFGAIHGNWEIFLPLTLFGILLALLYKKTGNLLAPILTHSFFNFFNFLLIRNPEWLNKLEQHLTQGP